MAYYLVAKELCILFFQSEPVILFLSAPVFQRDHQIDILRLSDTLHTKHRLNIYDTDSPKFDEMSCNIRCRTHQCLITDLADLNYIICHQTMTSLNQFQSGLAFTDPTLTHDQDAYTIYIHKYSVN